MNQGQQTTNAAASRPVGAVVIPALSDRQRKRQRYLAIGFGLAIPGLVGLAFANQYWALMISSFTLGF